MQDDLFGYSDEELRREEERRKCPFPVPIDVCHLFEKLTLEIWNKGWEHYSARAVLHRIRWHFDIDVGDRGFKANNNWTPTLARWCMRLHPEISDFFRTRASPRNGGPRHSSEDYAGPYE
jgi:hypothetical protein